MPFMNRFLYLVLFSFFALHASVDEPLGIDPSGLPMIRVYLTDAEGRAHAARFLLDTGAEMTVLDQSLAKLFAVDVKGEADVIGVTGDITAVQPIRIRGLAFGGTKLKNVGGVRMNLADDSGRFEDSPLDGVLGMNVLRGLRFALDFQASQIEWGASAPEGLYVTPLHWSREGLPMLEVSFSGKKLEMLCDTGSTGFLELLQVDLNDIKLNTGEKSKVFNSGISGFVFQTESQTFEGLAAVGSKGWCNPVLDVRKSGSERLIGREAFGPKVWFDFAKGRIGLTVAPKGCLSAAPPIRCPIAAMWEMRAGVRCLVVLAVKPNSPYEKAGVKAGDQLIQVDGLVAPALTIRSLMEKLNKHDGCTVTVNRDDKKLIFEISRES